VVASERRYCRLDQAGRGRRDREVVETIEDFAGMKDSRSGLLLDHTVINYNNTSSISLAAREALT
jgi:vacuolar-type H+-ATPase catalytic subunit A/Vma1